MSELTLLLSLLIAFIVPRFALNYLQPIMTKVLQRMCEDSRAIAPGVALVAAPGAQPAAPSVDAASDRAAHLADSAAQDGAEFWWRVLNVLAISGSILLVLLFGYRDGYAESLSDFLRRTLGLVATGVFLSVSAIALRIQAQVRSDTRRQHDLALDRAFDRQHGSTSKASPASAAPAARSGASS